MKSTVSLDLPGALLLGGLGAARTGTGLVGAGLLGAGLLGTGWLVAGLVGAGLVGARLVGTIRLGAEGSLLTVELLDGGVGEGVADWLDMSVGATIGGLADVSSSTGLTADILSAIN